MPAMHHQTRATRALAEALIAADWRLDDLVARGTRALGKRTPPRWFVAVAARFLEHFWRARPTPDRAVAWLSEDPGFAQALRRGSVRSSPALQPVPVLVPALGPPATWGVPPLVTVPALAAWLAVEPNRLDWWADRRGLERRSPDGPLRRYDAFWRAKRDGSSRLIEIPRPGLKACQRRLLAGLIGVIPPHSAAHGFCPGRSVATFVAPHVGQAVVLKFDLRDFFGSVTGARVAAIFRTAGYPEDVARTLMGLGTNIAPLGVWNQPGAPARTSTDFARTRQIYRARHLPQGAPTSPALANLAACRLDARLSGLAQSAGAVYTRYADDLAFSGDAAWARSVDRFAVHVAAIIHEEGFAVHHRKTRVMRQGVRQILAGAVVNLRPNVARPDFDTLKATLHNCVRSGPTTQNRNDHPDFQNHLRGRVAHVASLNPERGAKLRTLFDQINWTDGKVPDLN